MEIDKINTWLSSGCDYTAGVELYKTMATHNKQLLQKFTRGCTPVNQDKLKYELTKALPKHPPANPLKFGIIGPIEPAGNTAAILAAQTAAKSYHVHTITPVFTGKKRQAQTDTQFENLPPALRDIRREAIELFLKNQVLKLQLNELPEEAEEEALKLQLQIHANFKRNDLCWQKIDYWLQHKKEAPAAPSKLDKLTPAQLYKREKQLQSSISKLKKRLAENIEIASTSDSVKAKSIAARAIEKQRLNLITQKEELLNVTQLINGN